ncbi:hypothetical protein DFJ77DRAFT_128175 [Powellomyces hirtus]|nr:hypothetical protein DFJ77DRAFT_128175 [Powellomyces hirtus]
MFPTSRCTITKMNSTPSTAKTSTSDSRTTEATKDRPPAELSTSRLYIGNLSPALTEYHLTKLFTPHGQLTKIDYLWHKHGPHKGEPRGYCFVEYANKASALRAIEAMNGKVVAGRSLVVSFSVDHGPEGLESAGVGEPIRRPVKGKTRSTDGRYRDIQEPVNTKLQAKVGHTSTDSKISAIERKLQQLQGQGNGGDGSSSREARHKGRYQPYKK